MIVVAVDFIEQAVHKVQDSLDTIDAEHLITSLTAINREYSEKVNIIVSESPHTASMMGIDNAVDYRNYVKEFNRLKVEQVKLLLKPNFYNHEFFIL